MWNFSSLLILIAIQFSKNLLIQTLSDEDIDQEAWKEAKVDKTNDAEMRRCSTTELMFFGGSYIANMKVSGSQLKRFKNIFLVAEILLVLSHNNAEAERLFCCF